VPRVPAAVFSALAEAWRAAGAPARGWLAPCVETEAGVRFGHPVVLGRALAAELKDFPPAASLRELRNRASPWLRVLVSSGTILEDLDTPDDLARLRSTP
jgi:CTP:molybdopterin cytidylyltransferase MocA